jgi:serine/threonine-protein kinase
MNADAGAQLGVGDVLDGRYQLLRDLGRGAAGVVFEARHLFTGRFVAVKLLLSQATRKGHAELRARLEREGRALASIRHPGVVQVLDGGLTPDGYSYLVLEMLEGRTLEGLLAARSKLSVADTVGVALQLCDALEAVHHAGVVHRDVKPSNIIVLKRPGGVEVVKLVDFGVAKLMEPAPSEKLTQHGAILGTPAYMSPEQLLVEGELDPRSDVYSLGATLYECLSGKTPHEGNYGQILRSAAGGQPHVPLRSLVPEIPQRLGEVVDRTLARFPASRFASMKALFAAIEQAVPGASHRTTLRDPLPSAGPSKPSSVEHRRVARAPYSTPVRLVLPDGGIDGRSEDISEGGLLVLSRTDCTAGQRITLRFALPMEGNVVSVEADVRWARAALGVEKQGLCAIGLEFVHLPDPVRASVEHYVALMAEKDRG